MVLALRLFAVYVVAAAIALLLASLLVRTIRPPTALLLGLARLVSLFIFVLARRREIA
jgi:hypothetical protein